MTAAEPVDSMRISSKPGGAKQLCINVHTAQSVWQMAGRSLTSVQAIRRIRDHVQAYCVAGLLLIHMTDGFEQAYRHACGMPPVRLAG